jgi:hypothetical protein
MTAGRGGCNITNIEKLKKGDILWFCTNKQHGGEMIGMAEYYNRQHEPILPLHTFSE